MAFATIAVGFELINHLITLAYPQAIDSDGDPVGNGPHAAVVPHVKHLWLLLGAIPALGFSCGPLLSGASSPRCCFVPRSWQRLRSSGMPRSCWGLQRLSWLAAQAR